MLSLQQLVPISLLVALLTTSAVAQVPEQTEPNKQAQSDLEEFERLLDQVDPPSLHAALHDYSPKKFDHGMFEKDRTAAEYLHRDDASLASSIVSLAKRQTVSNGTASIASPPAGPSTSTSPAAGVSPSTPASPVPQGGSSQTTTSPNAPTSSPNAPGSVTTTSPVVAGGSTPANAGGTSTTSAGAGGNLTPGQVVTTTNAQGVTIVSTVGGGVRTLPPSNNAGQTTSTTAADKNTKSSQTTTSRRTTTLPDGSKSTVTAVTVVPAPGVDDSSPSGTAGVGTATGTSPGAPGLQTGIATRTGSVGREMMMVLGGAVGVAMLM
ncbi:MAG: hypothetical protein Q9191_006027 [Dirinaria sp. TL-2023a]